MVREGPVGALPEAGVDARGGDRAGAQPQPVHGLAAEGVGDLDLIGRSAARPSPPTRRSPPQSTAKRSRARRRCATASAARPLPVPPVSSSMPGGRRTAPRASSTCTRRQRAAGCGRAARRGGCRREGLGQAGGRHPGQRGGVAGAAQRGQDRRVDEAAGAPRGPQAGAHRRAQQRRRGDGGAAIAIERAQLAVVAKARQARVEGRQPRARVVEAGPVGGHAGGRRCPCSGRSARARS